MTASWFMSLDIDVERDYPRDWWDPDASDCLPDGIAEDEKWALIRRSGASPHRAVALAAECNGIVAEGARALSFAPETATPPSEGPASTTPPDGPLPAESPLLLTIKEAAERLGVGRCMVQQLVLDGSIRSFKIGTKLRRIPPEALDEYIQRSLGDGA